MDMDTIFTTLYVLVDDWYKAEIAESMQRHRGGRMRMSDSEVLTVALAGQWQAGMPWRSEREVVAYCSGIYAVCSRPCWGEVRSIGGCGVCGVAL